MSAKGPGADDDSAETTLARPPRRTRRFVRLGTLLVGVAILVVVAVIASTSLRDPALPPARAHANAALRALSQGDLVTLDRSLSIYSADPDFAYYFTRDTTPRELGDLLATVARTNFTSEPAALETDTPTVTPDTSASASTAAGDIDADAYDRALTDLADTLALGTRGTGDLALPSRWAADFAAYTTDPVRFEGDDAHAAPERTDQDLANKQNLLLLLARGAWSTGFLMTITQSYWNWEHDNVVDPADSAAPATSLDASTTRYWPGRTLADARYAPAPSGAFLTDGMVALLAALTANPEAAGWAFTDFQPGLTTVDVNGTDRTMGVFADYLFFERDYGGAPGSDTEGTGMTASVTALISAIDATGGSYQDDATGPLSDMLILQDTLAGPPQTEKPKSWYAKVGDLTKRWGHTALDALGLIPGVGVVPDAASGVWSAIEGDWTSAGLSLVAMVPVAGALGVGGKLLKDTLKARKALRTATLVDHAGKTLDTSAAAVKALSDSATMVAPGKYLFTDAKKYVDALENDPVPGVTYQFLSTSYRLDSDGKTLVKLSGEDDLTTLKRRIPSETDPSRSMAGSCLSSGCKKGAQAKELAGIRQYEKEHRTTVLRKADTTPVQIRVRTKGIESPRYFDAVSKKPDGTYEGIEVKSGQATRTPQQSAFDDLISPTHPATGTYGGTPITITSVALQRVAG